MTNDYPPPPIPQRLNLKALREAVPTCRACDLWEPATQAVMGEGAARARVMLVGEQPGDREDRDGHPFVGPAGRVLDEGLEQAGIERHDAYVSNVVKHFRYELRGKRRIHQTPDRWHVSACLPWLEAELSVVKPEALVLLGATAGQALLGATAGQALLGPRLRIGRDRGQALESDLAELVTVTAHPSAILRQRAQAQRAEAMAAFVADLTSVADWLKAH